MVSAPTRWLGLEKKLIDTGTKLLALMLLTWGLAGCQQEPKIDLSPADRLRAAIASTDVANAIGGIALQSDTSPDSGTELKIDKSGHVFKLMELGGDCCATT
jgi:hypothetical protein